MSAGIIAIAVLLFWVLTLHQQRTEAIKTLHYFQRQVIIEADLAHQLAALEGGRPLEQAAINLESVIVTKGDSVYGEAHFWVKNWIQSHPDSRLQRELQAVIRKADFTLEFYDQIAFSWNRALTRPWNRAVALVMNWEPLPCLSCLDTAEVQDVQSLLIPI